MPPVSTTVPLAGSDAVVMTLGPPSPPSVSLARTSIAVAAASSATVAVSSTATGGTSQVTVTETVAVL
ncbi:hypothetical protein LTR94_038734, partial [Friedmanniomyces endolithicus]